MICYWISQPLVADIIMLHNKRQDLIDKCLLKANASRISHDYKVDEEVSKKEHLGLSDKLKSAFSGPCKITQIHANGTVTIQLSANQSERINTRRIKPYHRRSDDDS